ncbi:uncharacterized protein LOC102374081 [Alligator sinensis]|uniref:Uncharacterized protein LOC102374081 n=1 Tax=Alligator sinensis TaxID=38654 RepID=A0A3Q0H6Q7_ALLSI|nr:uncharacterized protein LOC102374081 [Alligator sinensis]
MAAPPLACLCELCDCGRHKRHKNCRKQGQPAAGVQEGALLSHYQATYTYLPGIPRCSSKRLLHTPLHPNPPGKALSTTQRAEFVPPVPGKRTKPCVQAPAVIALQQPPSQMQHTAAPFAQPSTTAQDCFGGRRGQWPTRYGELPALTGAHNMTTTHGSTYCPVPLERRGARAPAKGAEAAGQPAQVEYMTWYQSDFPARASLPARALLTQPAPDNLAINQSLGTSFQTVQRESYRGWDPGRYPRAGLIRLKDQLGRERGGEFSGDTVTKLSYPPLPLDRPSGTVQRPTTVLKSLAAKFSHSTAHKFFFRDWGAQPRIRHGDPHDGIYVRPLAKFECQTTTHSTYLPKRAEKAKSCKPEQQAMEAQGEQDFSTTHRDSYRLLPLPVCRLQMYLIQQQQKAGEEVNSLAPVEA